MSRTLFRFNLAAGLCLLAGTAWAQTPVPSGTRGWTAEPPRALPPGCGMPSYPGYPSMTTPPSGTTGTDQGMGAGQTPTTPGADQTAAQQSEAGTQPSASFSPVMFGDLIGVVGQRLTLLPPGVSPHPNQHFRVIGGNRIALIAPQPTAASMKITEGESPRPECRVFLEYNYYNNVDRSLNGLGTDVPRSDLHREMIGFERTFLDGNASVGLRVPFLQLTGADDIQDEQIGDLSVIFKYAFLYNHDNGDVLSGGLVLTAATGQAIEVQGESDIHAWYFQPFAGFIYHFTEDLFAQGFSSVAIASDSRDVTLFFNSLAIGWHAYRSPDRDALLTQIIPVVELHANNPLNHRGLDSAPIGFQDTLDVTAGVHVLLRQADIGLAACVPLSGPKPYDFELAGYFNYHF
jgi:hypothetical protein